MKTSLGDIEINPRHFPRPWTVAEGKQFFGECMIGNRGCCFEALELPTERKDFSESVVTLNLHFP